MKAALSWKANQRGLRRAALAFQRTALGRWTSRVASVAILVVFVLLLPVIVPLTGLMIWNDRRRLEKAAESFPCIVCGEVIGKSALRLAQKEWVEYLRRLRLENPGVRFRLHRPLDAICGRCGQRYKYLREERTFVLFHPRTDAESSIGLAFESSRDPGCDLERS